MSTATEPARLVILRGADPLPADVPLPTDRLAEVRQVDAAELPDALPGADILLVWELFSTAVAAAWPKADRLRWVHTATAGVDHLLFPALARGDVVVTNSRGVFDRPMAEYVLGLVLAFAKDLPGTLALQRETRWRHRESEPVAGRRALVVGTGPIGRAIARQLAAVGMEVTGVGRVAREHDPDLGPVHATTNLRRVLPEADYVVLAAPLTDQTRGMVDAAALRAMRPTARLINVARGALVVEADLVAALERGEIAGAALDVFATEPLPESSPLWRLPGVIVSPHMSGDVVGWRGELFRLFVDNLDRYLDGRRLHNVVDLNRGYVPGH